MAAKASKTVIGAFVVGAVALAAAGIMVFGSGKFFAQKTKFVVFFDSSVKGLSVGAPVMFKGVKVGEVTDIIVRYDPADVSVAIKVIFELEQDAIYRVGDVKPDPSRLPLLVEKGLRAQLQMQSFVTGQLMIGLDFFPGTKPNFTNIKSEYEEIPTTPSTIAQLSERLQDIPFEEIFENLDDTLQGLDAFINRPELAESVKNLNLALKDAGKLLKDVNAQVEPLAASVKGTSEAARGALVQAEKTLAMEEGVPGELIADLRATLGQMEQTLKGLEGSVAKDARLVYELNTALRELAAAARSMRILTETIETEPETLVRGKKGSKGE